MAPRRRAQSLPAALNDEPNPLNQPDSVIPEVHWVDWANSKNRYIDDPNTYAVEVLLGKPKFFWQRQDDEAQMRRQQYQADQWQSSDETKSALDATYLPHEMPDRIRISSLPLLTVLADIAPKLSFTKPIVFLRPYKFFVRYEDDIRKSLAFMKKRWGDKQEDQGVAAACPDASIVDSDERRATASNVNGNTATTPSKVTHDAVEDRTDQSPAPAKQEDQSQNSKNWQTSGDKVYTVEAYQSLKCLVDFLDIKIHPLIQEYTSGTRKTVYFQDLWHIFKPGDKVFESQYSISTRTPSRFLRPCEPKNPTEIEEGRYQRGFERQNVWRVLEVSQGRSMLRSEISGEEIPRQKVNPFKVQLYSIDFDGDRFGPSPMEICVAPFEGEKEITKLDIFPFAYLI